MGKRYVVEEQNDNGFGCILALVIIIAVIAVLAYIFAYALLIGGIIVLVLGALIGFGTTIKHYFGALGNSISLYSGAYKPSGWPIPTFLYRYGVIFLTSVRDSWISNIAKMRDLADQMKFYRIFGFKKWICLFAALSILFFGTVATAFLFFLQFMIIGFILGAIVSLFAAITMLLAVVGISVSLVTSVISYISLLRNSFSTSGTDFPSYITDCSFKEIPSILTEYWSNAKYDVIDKFSDFANYPILSPKKWFLFSVGTMKFPTAFVVNAVALVLHGVILGILYLIFITVKLIKKLFHRI